MVQGTWKGHEADPGGNAALAPPGQAADDLRRLDSWCDSNDGGARPAPLLSELQRSDPAEDRLPAEGLDSFPEVGDDFLGFRLVGELGRGAFGRVFLAHQGDLSDRPVALKVSTEIMAESRKLARLQHTNIVPVYSAHRRGPLQAVCMPYLGSTTLDDVLLHLAKHRTMPASGKGLVSTLQERKSRTRCAADGPARPGSSGEFLLAGEGARPAEAGGAGAGDAPAVTLKMLEGLPYVDAVLWIGAKLADGLAHAHERGILHRDLKPANVLLTDDGQPMLLDFNLSAAAGGPAALVGGTLPYMAPEHLEAFRGQPQPVDERADVYALGILLYELLTGRSPFKRLNGPMPVVLEHMLQQRRQPPPPLRSGNPAVTPAVEAILYKCLEADPARRYRSARDLQEDLERQLDHRPLRHAPDRSPWERLTKWARRHPRLSSSTSVAVAAALLVALLVAGLVVRDRRLTRLEAVAALNSFRDDLAEARLNLTAHSGDPLQVEEGRAAARRGLSRYRVLERDDWQAAGAYRNLTDAEREGLPGEVGELLLLLAREALRGEAPPEEAAQAALQLNRRAEACFPANGAPRALWVQRAEIVQALGQPEEAERLRAAAAETPVRGAWDRYLLAREEMARGRFPDAIEELRRAVEEDPRNFPTWYMLGVCSLAGFGDHLGHGAEAVSHFTTCVALRPKFAGAYFSRGLARLRLREFAGAEADFSRALELRPGWPEAYVHRARARQENRQYQAALADLDRALEAGPASTRVFSLRARVRGLLGDEDGARRDREEELRREPADEEGWVARGVARLPGDPAGALADFERAVRANPRSLAGLHNQAHVLSECLGRPADALKRLDRVLELYPDLVPAYGGRGVLRARLGERAGALADAREALRRDSGGETLFQAACVYALTSRKEAEDRHEALRLLAQALRQGFGLDLLETDTDLEPLRKDPQFRELVRAARALRTDKH
jgi:serine/threonine protein kinase/Flp pilus assembly protein TadD